MKRKKAKGPRSARLMAADSRLQKESAFGKLSAEWSQTHTEQHGRLIVELFNNGHSLRCIARNLPGLPDESVVRDLKNSAKPECEQGLKEGVPTKESKDGQADQPPRSAKPASSNAPDQKDAPGQANVPTDSTEQADAVVSAPAETQKAKGETPLSPAERLADVTRRVSADLNEQKRKEQEYLAKCKQSQGDFLGPLRREPLV